METKEQYMVTPVMNLAETVKMINKMKVNVESNISLVNQLQANIVTLQKSTAHGLVVHNGKVLVQVERKAREGDYVVFEGLDSVLTINGEFYEVYKNNELPCYSPVERIGNLGVYGWQEECPNPKVYEVIGNLPQSNLVAEAFEPILIESGTKPPCKHMSANQKRARVIQMAKEFVEDQKTCHTGIVAKGNPHEGKIRTYKGIYKRTQGNIAYLSNAEFIRKGNRVTCLLKGVETSKVHFVGRAECHVDDVFNEHIGRAVALAKALDIVEQLPPDILKAVQPNKVVVGQRVKTSNDEVFVHGFEKSSISERTGILVDYLFGNREDGFTWLPNEGVDIIDDTDADYASLQGGEN